MSILTRCNYCSLQRYKRIHGEENITTRPSRKLPGWIAVVLIDEEIAQFYALSEHCCC